MVRIVSTTPWGRRNERRLARRLRVMLEQAAPGASLELSVALVGELEMKDLNRRYLGKDEVTDVLSFPQMTGEELAISLEARQAEPEPLGDIAICLPVAERQAAATGQGTMDEVTALAAHGLLHLLGFDDSSDEGARLMEEAETRLIGRSITGRG